MLLIAIVSTLPLYTPFYSHVRFVVFPCIMQPQTLLDGLKGNKLKTKQFLSPATVSTDNPSFFLFFYTLNHDLIKYARYQ
jgi:hypothetical protein